MAEALAALRSLASTAAASARRAMASSATPRPSVSAAARRAVDRASALSGLETADIEDIRRELEDIRRAMAAGVAAYMAVAGSPVPTDPALAPAAAGIDNDSIGTRDLATSVLAEAGSAGSYVAGGFYTKGSLSPNRYDVSNIGPRLIRAPFSSPFTSPRIRLPMYHNNVHKRVYAAWAWTPWEPTRPKTPPVGIDEVIALLKKAELSEADVLKLRQVFHEKFYSTWERKFDVKCKAQCDENPMLARIDSKMDVLLLKLDSIDKTLLKIKDSQKMKEWGVIVFGGKKYDLSKFLTGIGFFAPTQI